jgi:hypothetical protein
MTIGAHENIHVATAYGDSLVAYSFFPLHSQHSRGVLEKVFVSSVEMNVEFFILFIRF